MIRWRVDLEYDGADFAGWQLQPNARTVQGVVEAALEGLLGHPVRVHAAGRTDAGVHALQQVIRFDTEVQRPARGILSGLNAALPPDVACTFAEVVPPTFDPRHTPHHKRYRYRWWVRPVRSPLLRGRAWHVRQGLDAAAMEEAVAPLEGTHDFSAFRAAGCASKHPVRTVRGARIEIAGDELHLVMEGTGFLRHMIRIIAGSLTEVGRGRRPPSWLFEVLEGRDRTLAGRTAPAHGLVLERITYEEG